MGATRNGSGRDPVHLRRMNPDRTFQGHPIGIRPRILRGLDGVSVARPACFMGHPSVEMFVWRHHPEDAQPGRPVARPRPQPVPHQRPGLAVRVEPDIRIDRLAGDGQARDAVGLAPCGGGPGLVGPFLPGTVIHGSGVAHLQGSEQFPPHLGVHHVDPGRGCVEGGRSRNCSSRPSIRSSCRSFGFRVRILGTSRESACEILDMPSFSGRNTIAPAPVRPRRRSPISSTATLRPGSQGHSEDRRRRDRRT